MKRLAPERAKKSEVEVSAWCVWCVCVRDGGWVGGRDEICNYLHGICIFKMGINFKM